MLGYANTRYLSDFQNRMSQTDFVFTQQNNNHYMEVFQTNFRDYIHNHSKIVVLCECSHECVWLFIMINNIKQSCIIDAIDLPTIIYQDNVDYDTQMQCSYVISK
jgi:hypothetical protein